MKRFVIFVAAVLVAGMGLSGHSQQSGTTNAAQKKEQIESRLFSGHNRRTIPEKLSSTSGDLFIHAHSATIDIPGPANPPPYPPYRLVGMACDADAVVLATAGLSATHMTEDKTFLYSDWTFATNEVLKNNAIAAISSGAEITVARLGGTMKISERTIYAIHDDFAAFRSRDQYLLFLEFIPGTGDYKVTEENAFRIAGPKVAHLTREPLLPQEEARGSQSLLVDARAAVAAAAKNPYCAEGAKHP